MQRRLYGDFLTSVRGVIHVGAHWGEERYLYAEHGLKVVWIEPIPEVFAKLVDNIRSFPDQKAINALITNEDGALCTLHISNNSGLSSSILDLYLHKDIWPDVTFTHDISVRSTRLPTALADISLSEYDAMILDTQGTELLILQSATAILGGFKYIQVEAANFEAYRNRATVDTINTFLRQHGFRLLHKHLQIGRDAGGEYFDLLFGRTRLPVWLIRNVLPFQAKNPRPKSTVPAIELLIRGIPDFAPGVLGFVVTRLRHGSYEGRLPSSPKFFAAD
jgi:FkbM family methyltransferase